MKNKDIIYIPLSYVKLYMKTKVIFQKKNVIYGKRFMKKSNMFQTFFIIINLIIICKKYFKRKNK